MAISLSINWPHEGPPADFEMITLSDLTNDIYSYTFDKLSFSVNGFRPTEINTDANEV